MYDEEGERDEDGCLPIISGPVIIKTDYGPSRLVSDEAGLQRREAYYTKGFMPYGSVPNGTAGTQEMDQLYGDLKLGGRRQARLIVAEREKAAAAARKLKLKAPPINLTNADLARIVNGR